ncbi:hypothetical protein UFOVP907_47 [uncultured Caudovirales phage]|uniref:Uncharacterized protein n=1 Tax=uncultured Caudovirales phage TaxID=2100421 RepID=A0A6J5PJ93_9CAUD|nr:hypothetical protein UFOVP907_47 [uncultured Caudovirales phage]
MSTPVLSTLYAAATESLVSDASATSTFEKMISVAFTHGTLETFAKELHETEKLIKKDFEVSSMPSPWRSAKSVVTSAMKMKIGLIDDNGGFFGKTALQNKIKEMKGSKEEYTTESYTNRIIHLLMRTPTDLDVAVVYRAVSDYIKHADF